MCPQWDTVTGFLGLEISSIAKTQWDTIKGYNYIIARTDACSTIYIYSQFFLSGSKKKMHTQCTFSITDPEDG